MCGSLQQYSDTSSIKVRGIKRSWFRSVCPSVCSMLLVEKRCVSEPWLLQNTNRKPMLEVESTDHCGRMDTRSDEKVIESEKRTT